MTNFRDCDIEQLDPCTIVTIVPCKVGYPKIESEVEGKQTRTYRAHILVGGPSPCNCGDVIKQLAYNFIPSSPGEIALLREGETYTDFFGAVFVCRSVSIEPESRDCRKWVAITVVDNTCSNNAWYDIDGNLITQLEDIFDAAARISFVSEDEKVPVQLSRYRGFYNGRGEELECTFAPLESEDAEDLEGACWPLQKMVKGKSYPVINSAGVANVPPPERDEGNLTLLITKPYTGVNGCQIQKMKNRINCDPIRICEYIRGILTFGTLVKAKCARITDITMDNAVFCDGTPIKHVSVKVSIRKNIIETLDDDGNIMESEDFGWDDLIPNMGYAQLLMPGDPDGFGGKMKKVRSGSSVLREIRDDDGNQVTEAQWLSCRGRAMKTEAERDNTTCVIGFDPDDIGYIRWQHYHDMIFADAENIPGFLDTCFFYVDPDDPDAEEFLPPGWVVGSGSSEARPFDCFPIQRCGGAGSSSS